MLRPRPLSRLVALGLSIVFVTLGCEESSFKPGSHPNPEPLPIATSQDELIQLLARAESARNCTLFETLFPAPEDSLEYFYFLNEPIGGVSSWGLSDEVSIAHRMFLCDSLPPPDLPQELWIQSITITLNRTSSEWNERSDLYRSTANPDGLDPTHWKATEAEYHADILFQTQGETDYRVDCRVNFVVVENLRKAPGAAGKFLIYRWEDLGNYAKPAGVAPKSWSAIKVLYA
jgi:hypothetical protein